MKFIKRSLAFLIVVLCIPDIYLLADSPLTSSDFYMHYGSIPEVVEARKTRKAEGAVLNFLLSNQSIDKKAAVINALGWNFRGQDNARLYFRELAGRKKLKEGEFVSERFNPSELFVLGYLLAMDDYFKMKGLVPGRRDILGATAFELLSRAAYLEPDNFTMHFILALVESQLVMEKSFCSVYTVMEKVLDRFPSLKRNMKPEAVGAVMKYISVYSDYCREEKK